MAIRVIDDTKLNNIAIAIQGKDSGGTMTVDDMPDRIDALPTGGTLITKTITENGVYNAADDNADGYDVVTVDVPQDPNKNLDDYIQGDLTDIVTSVTNIADNVFYNSYITGINMPNVVSIGNYSFYGCSRIDNIILSNSLISLGSACFRACSAHIAELPNSLTALGVQCFMQTANVSISSFPESITTIPAYCFNTASGITHITMPSRLSNIGVSAFFGCQNLSVIDMSQVEQVPTVSANTFANTTCTFLFRDQTQLDEYANATNWSALSSRFQIKPSGVI